MFVYTIVDTRTGEGYTGKSDINPSGFLKEVYYLKTDDLPIYKHIRNQGVDWFKLTIVGDTEEIYKKTLKKINTFNPGKHKKTLRPKQSEALKRYYKNRKSPFFGKTHENLFYWKNKKGPNQYSWLVIYRDHTGQVTTEPVDNLARWCKNNKFTVGEIKWRCQPKVRMNKKPPFPHKNILDIRCISRPAFLTKKHKY